MGGVPISSFSLNQNHPAITEQLNVNLPESKT